MDFRGTHISLRDLQAGQTGGRLCQVPALRKGSTAAVYAVPILVAILFNKGTIEYAPGPELWANRRSGLSVRRAQSHVSPNRSDIRVRPP